MTPPAEPRVLTLDVGTSSVRALVFDREGKAIDGSESRRPYSLRTTPDGGGEADPELLVRLVEEALDETVRKAGGPVAAVACCTFWHSVMALDAEGKPLTPVTTWADTRAEPLGRALKERLDEKAYHARTGAFFHPVFLPPKILWLKGRGVHAASWVSFGEYLYRRLFGRLRVSVSMASATGLFDVGACAWDGPILEAIDVAPAALSPVGDEPFRGLQAPHADRWPSLRDIPWFPAVGDGACNNLGSGCATADRMAVMVGTSGALRVAWAAERVAIPWGLWCYRADRRRVVLGGALNDGGNLVEWIRNTFKLAAPGEVEREMAAMEPDAHGLTFLPFLAGERSPGWAADARGAIAGLRLATRPAEILRAALEAVALRFKLVHDLLSAAVPGAREVVASGGGLLKSPAWMQVLADVLGLPIFPSGEEEASSRGAALLALEALGAIPRVEDVPARVGPPIRPDARRHDRYRAALERQQRHYSLLVQP